MDENLISKKELLEMTGISYGQLYRWKRKKLIPETWFIKKSSFTGQETFFQRDKILARIDKIKGMKGDIPLDKLADLFSLSFNKIKLTAREILEQNIVTEAAVSLYAECVPNIDMFAFEDMVSVYMIDKAFKSGQVSRDECKMMLELLIANREKYRGGKNFEIFFARKLGVSTCLMVSDPGEIYFESGLNIVFSCNFMSCVEGLKIYLNR